LPGRCGVEKVVFSVTLVAEVLSAVAVGVSILLPRRRVWPPPHQSAWTRYVMWFLFGVSASGVITLGIIDWGSLDLPPGIRWAMGAPLWSAGNALALWAMVVLGVASTSGGEKGLIRRGPYRVSRNPQYVGFVLGLIGWAVLTSSRLTLVGSLVGVIPLLLVPLAEEPWLVERYGTAYEEYRQAVPRFIGQRRYRT
jgi:protein-S-isoprenylcysteine O-methyltransferase Ste14